MIDLPGPLRLALEAELDGYTAAELTKAAERLSQRYRVDEPATQAILATPLETAAYLTTRMPATYAAARQVFDRLAAANPDLKPRTLLDLGAGTGACTWAAADAFPSLESSHLLDSCAPALAVAQRMLTGTPLVVTQAQERIDRPGGATMGESYDLAVCGYLLGELATGSQDRVLGAMERTATTVTVIEPGTPAGYRRVLAARTFLVERGRALLAPCPHENGCPLGPTQDWCHFAVRLTRSIRHRQVKGGERGYEDEKYAYVVASSQESQRRASRILRHPQIRTGHVRMTVCSVEPGIENVTVSKRDRKNYRAARNAKWGDQWESASD